MLPSFPKCQKLLRKHWLQLVEEAKAKASPLASMPKTYAIVECKKSTYERVDKSSRPVDIKKHSVPVSFAIGKGHGLSLKDFWQKAEEVGHGMAAEFEKHMFEMLEKTTAETGNIINLSGGNFTRETFLQMVEQTEHGYNEDGTPSNVLVASPEMIKALKQQEKEWITDVDFQAKLAKARRRKREEFDEREARRRLVD